MFFKAKVIKNEILRQLILMNDFFQITNNPSQTKRGNFVKLSEVNFRRKVQAILSKLSNLSST